MGKYDAFPPHFVVGLATSGHQVEGFNDAADWSEFELIDGSQCRTPSGRGVEHFTRFRDDVRLFAALGMSGYRFSVEWSRVEPSEGVFDSGALEHYRTVALACREMGLRPVITLNHFTVPRWLYYDGGWTNPRAVDAFARYAERCARALGDVAEAFCTLNEPNLPMSAFYDRGGARFPLVAGREQPFPMCHAHMARDVTLAAHRKAVPIVRSFSDAPTGMTLSLHEHLAAEGAERRCREVVEQVETAFLEAARGDDFVGVQNYGRKLIGKAGLERWPGEVDFLGYDYSPGSLAKCIRNAIRESGAACYVTEHGSCFPGDERRLAMVDDAFDEMAGCLRDGLDVRGYFHWCAFDAFEWTLGYDLIFGAIAVDRATMDRSPKPSAIRLGRVSREISRNRDGGANGK
ncbi:MAG: family 1 glycosylhydrolase [Polyangiaceae bacterium]